MQGEIFEQAAGVLFLKGGPIWFRKLCSSHTVRCACLFTQSCPNNMNVVFTKICKKSTRQTVQQFMDICSPTNLELLDRRTYMFYRAATLSCLKLRYRHQLNRRFASFHKGTHYLVRTFTYRFSFGGKTDIKRPWITNDLHVFLPDLDAGF